MNRFLELTFIASDYESKAVGVLSADSRSLKIATLEVTFHLVVDGDACRVTGRREPMERRNGEVRSLPRWLNVPPSLDRRGDDDAV